MMANEGREENTPGGEITIAAARVLQRMSERASQDPSMLGYVLRRYREMHGLTEAAVAGVLGCEAGAVDRLAICFMPRVEALAHGNDGGFREEVEKLAAAGPCAAEALASVVKEVAGVAAMKEGSAGQGWLMAARDRKSDTAREADGGSEREAGRDGV